MILFSRGRELTPAKARQAIPFVVLAIMLVLVGWYFGLLSGMWMAGFVVGCALAVGAGLGVMFWRREHRRA